VVHLLSWASWVFWEAQGLKAVCDSWAGAQSPLCSHLKSLMPLMLAELCEITKAGDRFLLCSVCLCPLGLCKQSR